MQATDLNVESSNVEGLVTRDDVERQLIELIDKMLDAFNKLAYEHGNLLVRVRALEGDDSDADVLEVVR